MALTLAAVLLVPFLLFWLFGILKTQPKSTNISYDCGFFSFINNKKSVFTQYYKIIALYVIFDAELVIVFPYFLSGDVLILLNHSYLVLATGSVLFFMAVAMLGIFYELMEGIFE